MVQHDLPTAVRPGAIIIGKTNVPELTLWPWTESTTWGTTRNPWNRNRTPGGSSGGSAAAVCTGMAAMALGSDGGGSIRYPPDSPGSWVSNLNATASRSATSTDRPGTG